MVATRPDVYVGVAFNADPFDVNAVPFWTDLTSRVYSVSSAARGRQYELDRNQAGNLSIDWHNADEALNPVNAGSPFSPNVLPYRQIVFLATWPPSPIGAAVNLINTIAGYDPTFESYVNGQTLPWAGPVGGTTVSTSTAAPFSGLMCAATSTLVAGATIQGMALGPFFTIPGRVYTASAWVRPSQAFNVIIAVPGTAGGTSSTAATYTRISVTFTASQPRTTVLIQSSGTVPAGNIRADNVQLEPGGSMSAFVATGQIIRSAWTRGYVERWPIGWVDGGFRGVSVTPCVGPLAILANADLHSEIRGSILAKSPKYYWHLQEPQGATTFGEASGNGGPPLRRIDSPLGPAPTFSPGTTMNIPGDAGGVGVSIGGYPSGSSTVGSAMETGPFGTPTISVGANGPTWAITMAIWLSSADPTSVNSDFFALTTPGPVGGSAPNIGIKDPTNPFIDIFFPGFSTLTSAANVSYANGKPHLYVATIVLASNTLTANLRVDDALISSGSWNATTFWGSSSLPGLFTWVEIGAMIDRANTQNPIGPIAIYAHAALWNRALSVGEMTDLWNASRGYPGELESTRITRYLASAGFTGPTNILTGASVMGPATVKEGDGLLDTCQGVSDSAFGNFFEDVTGTAYASRNVRYLRTASTYTFGERVDLGEYPYEGDLIYDFDPAQILNIADVERTSGIKAHAEDTTNVSQKRYGKKNFTRTVDIASDNEAIDAATWVVANRKDPRLRVAAITFDPAAVQNLPFGDGTMWPMVLNLEIGTRVTVKRRPKAANAGAGITMSADFFVEAINQHSIDIKTGAWKTTLLLSPVSQAQPWILGDTTYGVLDSTTVLGF